MKQLIVTLFLCIIVACTFNGVPAITTSDDAPSGISDNTIDLTVGVPLLLAVSGSAARYNDQWLITAAHNRMLLEWRYDEVYYHPVCDIALVKNSGDNTTPLGAIYPDQRVYTSGHPMGLWESVNEGVYLNDVTLQTEEDGCLYSTTTATVMSGMSGGGVYNEDGELSGVVIGVVHQTVEHEGVDYKRPTLFLTFIAVQEWIDSIIK